MRTQCECSTSTSVGAESEPTAGFIALALSFSPPWPFFHSSHHIMSPTGLCFLFAFLVFLLVDAAKNTRPPILHEHIRSLISVANAASGNSSANTTASATGVVPLELASDKQYARLYLFSACSNVAPGRTTRRSVLGTSPSVPPLIQALLISGCCQQIASLTPALIYRGTRSSTIAHPLSP